VRGAIENQVKSKMAVTAETKAFVDAASTKGVKQIIRAIARDPDKAEALGEKLGQEIAAALIAKYGKRWIKDTVKGANAVLDSI
jgi:hypothetical protein